MKVVRFATAFFFLFVLASQVIGINLAYATCCGCACTPWMGCTCRGNVDPVTKLWCAPCRTMERVSNLNVTTDHAQAQLPQGNNLEFTASAQWDVIQVITNVMSGSQCLRKKVALRLLEDTQYELNYASIRF